jgi:hypothetical protein
VSLIDNPNFWLGFGLLEIGVPLLTPNRRWAGALMVLAGGSLLASAFFPGALGEFIHRRPMAVVILGSVALVGGIIAAALRWRSRRQPPVPPSMFGASSALATPAGRGRMEMVVNRASSNTRDPELIQFTTEGRSNREITTPRRLTAIRFIAPVQRTVQESDLPAEVPIGKGKLIIKGFTDRGLSLEEENTRGDEIRAEIYPFRSDVPKPSTSTTLPPPLAPTPIKLQEAIEWWTPFSDNTNEIPCLNFTTLGRGPREIRTNGRPAALRFIAPVERLVRTKDLPVEIPVGSGRLIVKRFSESGFSLEERDTEGDWVKVEVYLKGSLN